MITVIRAVCVASALLFLPAVAAAATGVPFQDRSGQAAPAAVADATPAAAHDVGAAHDVSPFAVSFAPRAITGPPAPRHQGGTPPRQRDRLWNGALVGAGLGALAGVVGGQALLECSECAGFNVPLTFGVIGAGVGAAVGAGIDALRQTRPAVPTTRARITLAPLLGRHRRAVAAQVQF